MINNFKLIEPLLNFTEEGDCYFIQLLKRQKDNPEMKRNMVNVDNFFVYSLDEYREIEPRIIENCALHNARAYIRVNRRNVYRLVLEANKRIAEHLLSKQYKAVKNCYLAVAGEFHSEPVRRWVVDLDRDVPPHKYDDMCFRVFDLIGSLHKEANHYNKNKAVIYDVVAEIPTKNGLHLIVNPFNLKKFRELTPDLKIDIHQDNPTILYIP